MRTWIWAGVLLVVAGCSGLQSKVVGTWKVKGIDSTSSQGVLEKAAAQLGSALIKGTTFEFNDKGRVKMSHALGSSEGPYKVEGNEVLVMRSDEDKKPAFTFRMADDGTLESVKNFESDSKVVLERQKE